MCSSEQLPEGTLKICPRFVEFNNKCCGDLSNRYANHNANRSQCIKKCGNDTLVDICNIDCLSESEIIAPIFEENEEILCSSIDRMNYEINKSYTVQAHKCKKQIKTYQAFSKKANNRQDQNSWKVSGEYFYAQYIYLFIKFIKKQYIPLIIHNINNDDRKKKEMIKLIGIIFAVKLLKCLVKFERAKEKPLIRDRTLVNSGALHEAFNKLHPLLNVPRFYLIEKAKRKKIKKKIEAQQFHQNIGEFSEYLLEIQRKLVRNPNYNINYKNNDIMNKYNFPKDWILNDVTNENKEDDDDDDDDDEMEIDEEEEGDNEDIDTLKTENRENIGFNMIDIDEYNDNKNKKYYHNQEEISNQLDPVITMDLPPAIHIFTNNNNNKNNNYNIDDGDDNNTQYTDSTGHSHNSYISQHSQHHNNNNYGEYQSVFSEYNEGYISNGSNGSNHSHRSFQNTNNFASKSINKTGFRTQRNRKLEQELHIKQMRERRFIHNQQQQQQQQQRENKAIPRMPIIPTMPSTPFEANYGYNNNNNKNVTIPISPITPSTPTITINNNNINYNQYYHHHHHHQQQQHQQQMDNPFPVQAMRVYNNYNDNNCNQSVCPLFISSNNNERDNGFKLEFVSTSPTSINRVGSDTIMNGNVHTNDMGYSFNTNH